MYNSWILLTQKKFHNTIDYNSICIVKKGYVIVDGNNRIDIADNDNQDLYKIDRNKWNEYKQKLQS